MSTNPVLKAMFTAQVQEMHDECEATLATKTDLLVRFEQNLLELVKHQIEHDTRPLITIPSNPKLCKWLSGQRQKVVALNNGEGTKLHKQAWAIQTLKEGAEHRVSIQLQ